MGVRGVITPEERALTAWTDFYHGPTVEGIANLIRAAVAEEREACARLADNTAVRLYDRVLDCRCHGTVDDLAAAIRCRP